MPETMRFIIKHSSIGDQSLHSSRHNSNDDFKNEHNNTIQDYIMEIIITLLAIINVILRGISQVYLCNHPITGLFICIGLGLSSSSKLLIHALVGTICSTLGATILTLPETNYIVSGLCGYDGALVGCAVGTFLKAAAASDNTIGGAFNNNGLAITAVLSAVSGVVHMACRNMNDLPALTLSFNICVMAMLFSLTDNQSALTSLNWGVVDDDSLGDTSHWGTATTVGFFHDAVVRGVGQFIFIDTTLGGWFVIIGLAISSRWAAATTVLGSLIGCVTARYIMVIPSASLYLVRNGLFGYSSAGTCCAIAGGVFYHANFYSFGIAIFGAGLSVLLQTAINAILKTDGLQLPSLTIPFVLTTWLIMLAKSVWLDSIAGDGEDMDDVRFINFSNNETYSNVIQQLIERTSNSNNSWNHHNKSELKRRGSVERAVLKKVDSVRNVISNSPSFNRIGSFTLARQGSSNVQPLSRQNTNTLKSNKIYVDNNHINNTTNTNNSANNNIASADNKSADEVQVFRNEE